MADAADAVEAEACCGIPYGGKRNDGKNDHVDNNEHDGDHDKRDAVADAEAQKGGEAGVDAVVLADAAVAGQSQIMRQTGPGIC